jgi:drug/metabolite transporter, DME family
MKIRRNSNWRIILIIALSTWKAMIGAALAVLSAATSAISVVLVRKYSNQSSAFNISLAISWVGMLILWPLAVVLTDFSLINLGSVLLFALSGVLTPGFVRLLYYQGMKKLGAPVNSSLFSIYPLYTSLLAVLFLSEILAPGNWAGILLVFLGGILVEWSSREANSQNRHSKKDLIYPVLGGIALGVGSILRKSALILFDAPVLGVAVAYTASLLPFLVMLAFSSSTRKELSLRRDMRLFWVAGVGQAITWMLSFYALSFDDVSVITPLLSIEPVFVALFAFLYLRRIERVSQRLVVSIVLTVLGVVLVTAKF